MTPDYRTDKSSSLEGQGHALAAWEAFLKEELESLVDDAIARGPLPPAKDRLEDVDDDVRYEIAAWAKERSELMGFWLSWHVAGGFRQLEAGGWHRATIFRKLSQFRDQFGTHPDETDFPWITLDLRQAWRIEVANNVTAGRGE